MAHPIMPAPPNNLIWQRRGGGNMRDRPFEVLFSSTDTTYSDGQEDGRYVV